MTEESITARIPPEQAGQRLDKVLAGLFPEYSRGCLQNWLKQGFIRLDGALLQSKHKVRGGEELQMTVPDSELVGEVQAEPIALEVVYADSELIVIAKPVGLVVHPAVGNRAGTLQNALLHHYPELAGVPRSGIVHRLDKDTSGLLVVARSLRAHKNLVEQMQARTVSRQYDAIVQGTLISGGTVNEPIGRHPVDRKRMAVRQGGKDAITHYRIAEKFRHHTHLLVKLETGRTHQIRVHMAHIRKPLLGDQAYGGRLRLPPDCTEELRACLNNFKRQALHAGRLGLNHPLSGEALEWSVNMPDDMQQLLRALREDNQHDAD
jgi:23S rRNA pseudouridine1911/1915/1917 synthase